MRKLELRLTMKDVAAALGMIVRIVFSGFLSELVLHRQAYQQTVGATNITSFST